jgi:dTDP-4-amino-4,6-dideoxygalactose transaminase
VAEFERSFAEWCSTTHCVGVSSGLDALRLSLLAAGIERGDAVVVPAATFAATFEAVTQAGGVPVVVDVSEDDYGLDRDALDAALDGRTRFVMPVHLYGQMANVAAIADIARRHGLTMVEDACQAHGARRDGRVAGATGLAGAFSFYPAKNLGALGDAGAVVTSDGGLAAGVRALREHGQVEKYVHAREGYTARLDAVQALALLRKLPLLETWNRMRREAAAVYDTCLGGVGDLNLPPRPEGSSPVYHLYVVRTDDPDRLARWLAARGIGTARHYPGLPHRSEAYAWLAHSERAFPVAEALAREALSLPMFPGITEGELATVVDAVRSYFRRG